jgi:hypothetical protein
MDHGSLFEFELELELAAAGLAGSLLGVLVVSLFVLSVVDLGGSLDDLSASAAFL